MIGLELLAAYATGYLVRKARRVPEDANVDQLLDAGVDALYELVAGVLGDEPSLVKLQQEGTVGIESERTRQRVKLAIEDAADADPEFAAELERVVADLRASDPHVAASGDGNVVAGHDVNISATGGGVAAGVIDGSVMQGNPPTSGTASARPCPEG